MGNKNSSDEKRFKPSGRVHPIVTELASDDSEFEDTTAPLTPTMPTERAVMPTNSKPTYARPVVHIATRSSAVYRGNESPASTPLAGGSGRGGFSLAASGGSGGGRGDDGYDSEFELFPAAQRPTTGRDLKFSLVLESGCRTGVGRRRSRVFLKAMVTARESWNDRSLPNRVLETYCRSESRTKCELAALSSGAAAGTRHTIRRERCQDIVLLGCTVGTDSRRAWPSRAPVIVPTRDAVSVSADRERERELELWETDSRDSGNAAPKTHDVVGSGPPRGSQTVYVVLLQSTLDRQSDCANRSE